MKKKAIIFDLDGTLLNTLGDLTDSVNHALSQLGFPLRSEQEIRSIVGCGVHNLIRRSLPNDASEERFNECLDIFRKHYETNKENKTAPYDGIIDVLKQFKEDGYLMAIVSNKHEDALIGLSKKFFSEYITVAIGNTPELEKKPAPDMILKALDLLGAPDADTVYVGDSEVDFECSVNSRCGFIGVAWGFRDKELLSSLGARKIASSPSDIPKLIKEF